MVKSGEFSGSAATSSALTTGQANEGPVQATQSTETAQLSDSETSPAVTQPVTTAHTKHVKNATHATQNHSAVKLTMHSKRNAWMIQMGVFSNKKNANHLMSKLRAAHYAVYSHSVKHGHQTLMAVFVGPEMNLHKTEMLKQHLKQRFQLNGVVKKYQA